MTMQTPAPTPPPAAASLVSLSVEFLRSLLAPGMIPKWLRQLRESSPRRTPAEFPQRWQWPPWAIKCLHGGRSWALGAEEFLEESLPQNKEYHGFHDTCVWIFSYLENCSFHLGTCDVWLWRSGRVFVVESVVVQTSFGSRLFFGSGTQVIVTPSKCVFFHFCGIVSR